MRDIRSPAIAAPVEVAFVTQDGTTIWQPATVTHVTTTTITVAYSDGRRHTIERGLGRFRKLERRERHG